MPLSCLYLLHYVCFVFLYCRQLPRVETSSRRRAQGTNTTVVIFLEFAPTAHVRRVVRVGRVWTLMVFRCQSDVHFWKPGTLIDWAPWLYKLWGIEVEYSNSLLSFLLPSSPQHNRFFHPTQPRLYSLTMRFSAVVAFLGAAASVSASAIVARQALPGTRPAP